MGQNTSFEEDFGDANTEVFIRHFSIIDEFLKNGISRSLWVFMGFRFIGGQEGVAMTEVSMEGTIGETFTANTDAFQYTIASELIEHQRGIDHTGGLLLVGDDTTDEVRMGGVKHGHEFGKGFAIHHGDSHEWTGFTLLFASTCTFFGFNSSFFLSGVVLKFY